MEHAGDDDGSCCPPGRRLDGLEPRRGTPQPEDLDGRFFRSFMADFNLWRARHRLVVVRHEARMSQPGQSAVNNRSSTIRLRPGSPF